ncbi:MAG: hypothetical protein QF922_09045, partial [SAR324 cluster bacterium]|nr:hypothetical protein [SAR324 cluster bacterium]
GQVNFPHPLFHLGVEEMGRCGLGSKRQGFRLDHVAADAGALVGVRAAVTTRGREPAAHPGPSDRSPQKRTGKHQQF